MPEQLKQPFDFRAFATEARSVSTGNLESILKLCCKCKTNRRAPGQKYCVGCHNAAVKKSRQKQRLTPYLYETLMGDNPITKARFAQRFGPAPHVYVPAGEAHPYNHFRGVVVAFRPGDIVAVIGEFDRSILAELHFSEIRRDDRAPQYRTPVDLIPGKLEDPELRRRLHLHPWPAIFDGSSVQSPT